jgi:hypothetical protein
MLIVADCAPLPVSPDRTDIDQQVVMQKKGQLLSWP